MGCAKQWATGGGKSSLHRPRRRNINRAAMLANDYNHFAAHSGGAVLGSKKLKAIVVHGTKRPTFRDKAKLVDAGWRWRQTLQQHDVKKKKTKYGHGEAWGVLNNLNWRSTELSPAHIRGFGENDVVLRPCFQCARLCPWDAKLGEGEFKGTVVHFNAGGEWLDAFFNLGIKGNAVLYLAEKINNLGIECSHFSCGAGVAFEALEEGPLGPEKTNGLKLRMGQRGSGRRTIRHGSAPRRLARQSSGRRVLNSSPRPSVATRRSGPSIPKAERRRCTSGAPCSGKCCASWWPAAA